MYLSRVMFTNEERVEIKFHNEFNDCQNSKRKHSIVTRLINCNRIRLKKRKGKGMVI